jgi:predicted Zn finger-like uncharacterized protein
MLTQCPHCLTYFRVGPKHLKAAAGQVRCCRCHQVFNALQRLEESPVSFANSSFADAQHAAFEQAPSDEIDPTTEAQAQNRPSPDVTEDWLDFTERSPDPGFEPMLHDFDSAHGPQELIEDILEQDDGLEPEPDYFAAGTESQMSELLDQDSSSILLPDSEGPYAEPPLATDNILAFNYASEEAMDGENPQEDRGFEDSILKDEAIDEEMGKPGYESVPAFRSAVHAPPAALDEDDFAVDFSAVKSPKLRDKKSLYWLIGSVLLLPPLFAQILWQFRYDLIHHETGRQTLGVICAVAGCEVPLRRAVDKILIQGRILVSHPEKPDILLLQVNIVNTAAFDQPFPKLTLSLYNDKGSLIARRTFSAGDYLPPDYARLDLMPKAQPILVEMELVDPGKEVTGFSFDFF